MLRLPSRPLASAIAAARCAAPTRPSPLSPLSSIAQQTRGGGHLGLDIPAAADAPRTIIGARSFATSTSTFEEQDLADHQWRQQNHIWSEDEIKDRMATAAQKHTPVSTSDHIMQKLMQVAYHTFNTITGYEHLDPSPKSIEWRLIILESFAGVPGFLAATFRHFHSLRSLKRDHGMIYTLLEEAENERMHLLVCLKMFEAGAMTRTLVVTAQFAMLPFLSLVYAIKPQAMHRFVGYLEETAVETYSNIVDHVEKPGTKLHAAWSHLDAPDIAKAYWQMPESATWTDTLKRMLADEAHHRDVNHTFASLPPNVTNPFLHEHVADFDKEVVRRAEKILKNALEESKSQSQTIFK